MPAVMWIVTVVSAVVLPALALVAGWFASQYGDPVRVGIAIGLGSALWAVVFFVVRWLSARSRAGLAVILGVATMGAAMLATEQAILTSRGERVEAVVVDKTTSFTSGRAVHECELVQQDGGAPVEPDPGTSDCRSLDEGDEVTLLVDPEGQAGPVILGRHGLGFNDSTLARVALPAAVVLAVAQGITIVLIVLHGRRRKYQPRSVAAVDRRSGGWG